MAYTEEKVVASINVTTQNALEVLEVTIVYKDGVEFTRSNERFAFMPGDDISAMDDRVKAIAATVWTQAVIDAWKARRASMAAAYQAVQESAPAA